MSNIIPLRRQVLSCYKQLQRTREAVFEGDDFALNAARQKINSEFVKNKNETNTEEIEKLLKHGNEVELVLRKSVVQAIDETGSGVFRVKMRNDLELMDSSVPYSPMPPHMIGPFKNRKKCKEDTTE